MDKTKIKKMLVSKSGRISDIALAEEIFADLNRLNDDEERRYYISIFLVGTMALPRIFDEISEELKDKYAY